MKTLLILTLLMSLGANAQKWYSVTNNDCAVMACEVVSGYAQGWREELLYHPYEFMAKHPKWDSSFWFVPQSWRSSPKKFDANHILKGIVIHTQIAAIVIKIGDIKSYKKRDRWKKILFDVVKYYGSYQLGFFLSYNITHHNPIF